MTSEPIKRQIIIDTDPGTDDAVAILLALAAPELEVLAIVAVAGNVRLARTEQNARSICELAGRRDIPVYAGCPRPMGRNLVTAEHVHHASGLGNLVLPPPGLRLQPEHGVDFFVRRLRRAEPRSITLCTLGPLTNIAMALVEAPEIAAGIAEIVMMGGASRALGNVTPAAEFNIHVDPHAAALVMSSGLPITMIPLDSTYQVLSTPRRIDLIANLGTRCAAAAAELMRPLARSGVAHAAPKAMPLHDPCVIAYVLAPELFQVSEVNVAVEVESPLTSGMTVVDWRGVSGRPVNARVAHTANADGVYELLTQRLARLP
jgi:purine nucleosidase